MPSARPDEIETNPILINCITRLLTFQEKRMTTKGSEREPGGLY